MKKKVAVTGASGHIGFHVAKELLRFEFDVTLFIRKENENIIQLKSSGANVITVDFKKPETYQNHLESIDALFHLAAENTTAIHNEKRVIESTYELTKNVIDAAIYKGVKTIIYTSSVVVLGRSRSRNILIDENDKATFLKTPYIKGKYLAEQYCDKIIKEKGADIRRLYPSWVVGNNDLKQTPPHTTIKNYLLKGQRFYFNGGISVASVEEVAKAHVSAWLKGKPAEKYILAGNNISFKEFYTTLAKHSGYKSPVIRLPKPVIYLGAIAYKILYGKKSFIEPKYIGSVVGNFSWYSSGKAIKELGYAIPKLDEIISSAVIDAKKKILGLDKLVKKNNPALAPIGYEANDLLLITGFPGWLANRMLDVFMNGDRFGNYAVNRNIRLLIEPRYKDLISLPSHISLHYGDITNKDSLTAALVNVKTVYHLAGVIYPDNIKSYYTINFQGTKNLADACIQAGVRRVLFMSSDSVCGYGRSKRIFNEQEISNPYKDYGKSKYLAEKYILDKTKAGFLDGTSLRGFWFFGPFMPDRSKNFFRMFYGKRQIVFGNGKNFRSISHVDNIIQSFVKAERKTETIGKWYWIGSKKANYTINEIYSNISEGLGVNFKPLYIPKTACDCISVIDTIMCFFGKVNATIHAAGKFHKDIAGEITAAEKDFGYNPDVEFEEIKKELPDIIN